MPLEAEARDERSVASRATDAAQYGAEGSHTSDSLSAEELRDVEAPSRRSSLSSSSFRVDVVPLSTSVEDGCGEIEKYYTRKVRKMKERQRERERERESTRARSHKSDEIS
eukprot:scaffold1311_cov256-Pinguiococcus_pyrenoidosus.AAC.29